MTDQDTTGARLPRDRRPRVGIVAKSGLHAAAAVLAEIRAWLEQRGAEPVFEQETASLAGVTSGRPLDRDALAAAVDLMLVLGGDGTLLGMANRIVEAGTDIPIMGVNFGSLGFLTEITLPELYPSLDAAIAGTAEVECRLVLRAVTYRNGHVHADRLALNDVVITRGALSRIIEMSIWVGGQFVTRIRADGVIVASPTGSTAYNLAAGGPIVHPDVDAMVLTPIAPHMLTNRPVVVPGASELRVQPLVGHRDEIFVTFDGQSGFGLERGDEITVAAAGRRVKLVRATTRSYFEVLREKLAWGGR